MICIVTGPPCVGKSTYVEKNAKVGDLRIDYDKIAQALGGKAHDADGLIRDAAFDARDAAIKKALENSDEGSWIIHTNPTAEQLKAYKEAGAEFVVLDPGRDVCIERAKEDGRPQRVLDAIDTWYSERKNRKMEKKYINFQVKEVGDSGTVTGYASTFDVQADSYGDMVQKGAFTETIAARKETGHPFPLCWNHDLDQIIGAVDEIEEDDKGLLITASFFDTPLAQEKRAIVKSGVVYQFSFAYSIDEARRPTEDERKLGIAQVLEKVSLYECSLVVVPANQNAVVTDVKAADMEEKSGRRNRKSDEEIIKQIISLAESLLDMPDDTEVPAEGEDEPDANSGAKEEEQKASNPEKPALLEFIKNMEVSSNEHEI